ncbi:TetR/AcrR family transcriptional regulator [Fictibacillus terranigra]|uniref:TetR/AcrR family transcriptional regulator n=1 Tax=Fictibacillus terranigra TaxID=3058424 RepID=A0ABT8ECR3_9BACL|nr:TetR/AcrR family transcriptional regulator [Fictibacillus sp. CENA-BCM004]MDN4075720.1 TetR/AcrR family transcriptional regulator [Fictibacillus sp. CENA-BCM004]
MIDRKQNIIEAAAKSFSLFGYKATTMDQVAKIANVGKGTIYTFFENKEELFKEIVADLVKQIRHVANDAIKEDHAFHQNLHFALYGVLDFRKSHQLAIKIAQEGKELNTPAVKEASDMLEKAVLTFIKQELGKAIDKGEIKNCNTEITSYVMLKMYVSLVFDWEQEHEPLSKEEIADIFEKMLITGLKK